MLKCLDLIAVSSRSFSKNPRLRQLLQQQFLHVKFNENSTQLEGSALIDFLRGAQYAIIGLEKIDDALLSALPELKAICKMGTGIDKIDVNALKRRQIEFSHTPGLNKRSVSELVLALIFSLIRHLPETSMNVKNGEWQQLKGSLLSNKTIGIIGFGAIGKDLATLLQVFECLCLVYDPYSSDCTMPHVSHVSLDMLLNKSDIISLHVPLSAENYHLIGVDELKKMKAGSILINTARGGLIDENALYDELKNGYLSAAALDVFENEPNVPKKLLELDNFLASSHIGGSTEETIEAMGLATIQTLEKFKLDTTIL